MFHVLVQLVIQDDKFLHFSVIKYYVDLKNKCGFFFIPDTVFVVCNIDISYTDYQMPFVMFGNKNILNVSQDYMKYIWVSSFILHTILKLDKLQWVILFNFNYNNSPYIYASGEKTLFMSSNIDIPQI